MGAVKSTIIKGCNEIVETMYIWAALAKTGLARASVIYHQNHRCPGEWITIDLIKIALNMLVRKFRKLNCCSMNDNNRQIH